MTNTAFPKSHRLLTGHQFQRIFQAADYKVGHTHLLILARANQLPHPRLGLVVGKKHCKTAVGRNRLKRCIRETFRHQQHHLPGIDAIVLPRAGAAELSNPELHALLQQQWRKLAKRLHQKPEETSNQ